MENEIQKIGRLEGKRVGHFKKSGVWRVESGELSKLVLNNIHQNRFIDKVCSLFTTSLFTQCKRSAFTLAGRVDFSLPIQGLKVRKLSMTYNKSSVDEISPILLFKYLFTHSPVLDFFHARIASFSSLIGSLHSVFSLSGISAVQKSAIHLDGRI